MNGAPTSEQEAEAAGKRLATAFNELSKRATHPRKVIEQILVDLAADDKSFTADDLLRAVRAEDSRIGRATVFRSIERLVELRVLDRVDYNDGTHRYFVCSGGAHHHHLACTKCHRIIRFDYCLPEQVLKEIGTKQNFHIEDHALTIFGRCSMCRK